jgi:hypothetical protein
MIAMFSPHPGHHGRSRRAGLDEPAAIPEKAAPVAAPDVAPELLPAPVPEAEAPAQEVPEAETAPAAESDALEPLPRRVPDLDHHRERLDQMLNAPERPGLEEMRQLLDAVRGWDPHAPAAISAGVEAATVQQHVPEGELPEPARVAPERHREPAPPAGMPVLIGLGGARRVAAVALDGMPQRRAIDGKPAIHLGDDPRNDGEAFALGLMTDAYLDALIASLLEERGIRRALRDTRPSRALAAPSFTARGEGGARDDG